jgi:outer membrane immunogenic protein
MKKHLLAGCAAAALLTALTSAQLTSANAADLSRPVPAPYYKAPAMVAPAFSWTGLYLGLQGGYGWGHESYADNIFGPVSHSPQGGIFGGVLGYRYQIGQFVLGVEGTGSWADIKDTVSAGGFSETLKARSLYTATGQIGWAVLPQTLLYAKGGWAGASIHNDLTAPGLIASNSQSPSGWTVGAGIDYAVTQNVVFGIEYDHMDFGYSNFTIAPVWAVAGTSDFKVDQVVGRLTYKFNAFQ